MRAVVFLSAIFTTASAGVIPLNLIFHGISGIDISELGLPGTATQGGLGSIMEHNVIGRAAPIVAHAHAPLLPAIMPFGSMSMESSQGSLRFAPLPRIVSPESLIDTYKLAGSAENEDRARKTRSQRYNFIGPRNSWH